MEKKHELPIKLWPYQLQGVRDIGAAFESHSWVLYSLSTGAGKTVIFCHLLREWMAQGLRVCVVVNSRHLVDQTSAALGDVPHGIIRGGAKAQPEFPAQVATIQALIARPDENHFDVYVVDEAHHAAAASYQKALKGAKRVLGLTATPFRKDGIGLGSAGFTTLIQGPGIADLTPEYLSEAELYGPPNDAPTVDLRGIKKQMGDFPASNELAARVNQKTITGNAVEHYKKRAAGRRALVYCVTRKHARDVAKDFGLAGIQTAYLDGTMSDTERRAVLDALRIGKVRVVVSCELIGEGLDVSAVGCVILLRPTQSLRVLMQHVGRGLRRSIDGAVVVLDHVGNFARNDWFPTDSLEFTLKDRYRRAMGTRLHSLRQCSSCGRISGDGSSTCGACGREAREPVQVDGELARLGNSILRVSKGLSGYSTYKGRWTVFLGSDEKLANAKVSKANELFAKSGKWPDSEQVFREWLSVGQKRNGRIFKARQDVKGCWYVSMKIEGKRLYAKFSRDRDRAQRAANRANSRYLNGSRQPETEDEFREALGIGFKHGRGPLKLNKSGKSFVAWKRLAGKTVTFDLGRNEKIAQSRIDLANSTFEVVGEWPDSENEFRDLLGLGEKRKDKRRKELPL